MALIPRLRPWIGIKEFAAALTPSNNAVSKFENSFANKFGNASGVMFSHGRSGMYTFFKAMGLENDEIICPAYTCVVVQHAIVLSGNIPVFVDCAEASFNMDLDQLEAAITGKTRCIVVTHLFGYPMDVDRVQSLVKNAEKKYGHKIYVMQDVAHSYGAKWDGKLVTEYGDCAIFGCNVSKIMTSVFGGMLISNSKEISNSVRTFRDTNFKKVGILKSMNRFIYMTAIRIAFIPWIYSMTNWLERKGLLNRFVKYYDESVIYFPEDWDQMPCELEARVGLVQLGKYDEIISLRQRASKRIIDSLRGDDRLKMLPFNEDATYSHLVGVVDDRDWWVEYYHKKGIQLGILIEYSVPEMPTYQKYKRGNYPRAAYYADHCINFPIWCGVKDYDL